MANVPVAGYRLSRENIKTQSTICVRYDPQNRANSMPTLSGMALNGLVPNTLPLPC